MDTERLSRYKPHFIGLILVILAIVTLWIRLLTSSQLVSGNTFYLGQEPDISYNLRLIEITLSNFPRYPFFEAMTQYPYGTMNPWGPMYTMIIATISLVMGATTRPEIIPYAYFVPPILAVAMIPVMYKMGALLEDWRSGILAAVFTSIVSGQYLYRSLYGFADHHVAEVLFSAIFALSYIWALMYVKDHPIQWRDLKTLQKPLLVAVIPGIAFFLGLYTMSTMILFALIVAMFTLIQCIWNYYRGRDSGYLLVINGMTFSIAIIGIFLIGLQPSFSVISYSYAHVISYLLLIVGTAFLSLLPRYLGKNRMYYPVAILGIAIVSIVIAALVTPQLVSSLFSALQLFFGISPTKLTIQELRPWTIQEAWFTFHFGLILFLGGIGVLLYKNYKEHRPEHLFVLVWAVLIFYSTFQHVRYEYYLGPVLALVAAICAGVLLSLSWNDTWRFVTFRKKKPAQEQGKPSSKKREKAEKKAVKKTSYSAPMVFLFFIIAAFSILFIGMSAAYDIQVGQAMGYNQMHPDWRETLEWMGTNTPDPGVDYLTIYDKATFVYPPQSYGVMSWWDYGHWITFFAKRIPHANPFQAGVAGVNGSASFFIAPTEEQTVRIADNLTTKFVVTDVEMDTGKFWAMATWYNDTLGAAPYQDTFFITSPDNPMAYEPINLFTQEYYLTTISRLHNFDGSMAEPTLVYYIEYRDGTQATRNIPVVTNAERMNATQAIQQARDYNANAPMNSHATVLSGSLFAPVEEVPAMQHFRLIHESPTNALGSQGYLSYVKTFEHVPGARIRGEGIIEVDLVTNEGRTFTYRQESINGEFIVPYSTMGTPYDVQATGPYRIAGTDITFEVPEEAVQNGIWIN